MCWLELAGTMTHPDPGFLFFFLRFLLAHILGDFPFQTNTIVALKKKHFWGGIVHVLVHVFWAILLLLPVALHMWLPILLVCFLHLPLDRSKIWLGIKKRKDNLILFFVDQCVHLSAVLLAIVVSRPWQWFAPPPAITPGPFTLGFSSIDEWIRFFYFEDSFILTVILYLVATYVAAIIIMYLQRAFLREEEWLKLGSPRQLAQLIERGCLLTFLLYDHPLLLAIWAGARGIYFLFQRLAMTRQVAFLNLYDFLLNIFFSSLVFLMAQFL